MLICQNGWGHYGNTLHSPREIEAVEGDLSRLWPEAKSIQVRATAERLEARRADFQKSTFLFPIGENIQIHIDDLPLIEAGLMDKGVSPESIEFLKELFREKGEDTCLRLHVVHVADEANVDPYWERNGRTKMACCGVQDHGPYYELVPTHEGQGGSLLFFPKELTERVAELAPEPHPIRLDLVMEHWSVFTT